MLGQGFRASLGPHLKWPSAPGILDISEASFNLALGPSEVLANAPCEMVPTKTAQLCVCSTLIEFWFQPL